MTRVGITVLMLLLLSCSSTEKLASGEFIYWVNSLQVPCEGVGTMHCLQVQKGDSPAFGAWTSFHSSIEGFDYQEGFVYKLVVREKHRDPATLPADASSIAYTLIRVVEKNRDPSLLLNDLWVARVVEGEEVGDPALAPRLEIQLRARSYMGTDGCNRYQGSLVDWDGEKLQFGMAASTRMACPDMRVADRYLDCLTRVQTYRLEEGLLHLMDAKGEEILLMKKTD